jgi:SAM-dependent methyltransferase
MENFIKKYLNSENTLSILDVGSMDVNAEPWMYDYCRNYRQLFKNDNWKYTGLDISAGKNVDIVVPDLYMWNIENKYDVVISGQCLEHVKDVKEWILQVKKALKIGGIVCIIAPWQWVEHRHPVDCWRILPDGMRFLLEEICKFEILEIFKSNNDCVGIAKKIK